MKKIDLRKFTTCVFAAGKGTRIRSVDPSKPKAMLEINKKPMCSYIIDKLIDIGFSKPYILVGHKSNQITDYFQDKCNYIYQKKRLGTGHAAKTVLKSIPVKYKYLLILMGDDSAFYKKETIINFIADFINKKPMISFMVAESNDESVGRVIEDKNGNIMQVIEKDEMKIEDMKKYKLVNCAAYIFDINWMKKNINKLIKHMPKGEYYLPDLIKIAISQKESVIGYKIPKTEWLGINDPKQLEIANQILKEN